MGENCRWYQQRTATFQERSLHQVCAQTRATLVYYLSMLHGHAPLTLPIFPVVQKWISRRWILPPAVVAPEDFEGSKEDFEEVDLLGEMIR